MATPRSRRAEPPNALYAYVGAFVDELRRAGLRHAVVCPGSRSTPLALTLAAQDDGTDGASGIRVWMHVDERSAAYFGLGLAKRLGEPVALVCTSGTAAANFFPAVVEAYESRMPLLLLTADRPPELRDCGAPQAIDQLRLYGGYAKWFVDVALPEASNAALRYARTLADRAVATAVGVPAGPVHLNFPFREPLVPAPGLLPPPAERDELAWLGRGEGSLWAQPYVRTVPETAGAVWEHDARRVASALEHAAHGVLIAGPGCPPELEEPLRRLAERLRFPVLADPLSGLRGGQGEDGIDGTFAAYDAFLRDERFAASMAPDVVLRFGALPTSKPLLQYLQRYPHCPQIVVDEAARWEEPTQLASEVIQADSPAYAWAVARELAPKLPDRDARWLGAWRAAEEAARAAIRDGMDGFAEAFEGRVFAELAELLPDGAALVVGNSMPVRDCDTFFWPSGKRIRVLGNRGANGIDGVVSTALGVAAAQPDAPTVLVIGDLSLYHDLNGLLAARLHGIHLTIVLVNNDGGGIFSFLPQADEPEHFERLFGTPTGLDFVPAVRMYGGEHVQAADWAAFRAEVGSGLVSDGLRVIELRTERTSNVTMHRALWRAVAMAVGRALDEAGTPQRPRAGEAAR